MDIRFTALSLMKRRNLVIATLLIVLALVLAVREWGDPETGVAHVDVDETRSQKSSGEGHSDPLGGHPSARSAERAESDAGLRDDAVGRRELPGVAVRMPLDSGSGEAGMFGVRIDGAIKAGETLVMGGNAGPDGGHEFTFVTPTTVRLEDGSEGVRLDMRVLRGGGRLIEESGLKSLSGNAGSGIQVAEAWSQERVRRIMDRFDVAVFSGPSVVATAGESFTLRVGEGEGSSYSLGGTVSPDGDGGFAIRSDLERSTVSAPED